MGWFWDSSQNSDQDKDPFKDLDPSLREFLAKESPVQPITPKPQKPESVLSTAAFVRRPQNPDNTSSVAELEPPVNASLPAASLFQDGRYAELWKTYQSQAEIEAAAKTDHERVNDVLEGYKHRKAQIGRAALENCALEQWDVNECFRTLSWSRTLSMCRDENKKFERCYLMQSKFLKALGYLSTLDRPREVDEEIQMHADSLYHGMLDQERQIDLARAEGRPIPSFPTLFESRDKGGSRNTGSSRSPVSKQLQISDMSTNVQQSLKKRLDGLSENERTLEKRAIDAEIQAGEQVAEHLTTIFEKQEAERTQREQDGKATLFDKIGSYFR